MLAQRRRMDILGAAVVHFSRHGFQATDLDRLAEELGIAKGTVYRYFPSKEKLFLAAVDYCMVGLREFVLSAYAHLDDPLDQLQVGIRAYLEYFKRHPDHVELLIQERAVFRDRLQPTYFEHRRQNTEHWRENYMALIRAGRIRDIPVASIMDVIHDLVYGTMFTNYFTRQHKSLARQSQDIVDILFHGILTEPERQARKARLAVGTRDA